MSEIRKDPVMGRWVIIAADRGKRPNDFSVPERHKTSWNCPFCEGGEENTPPEIYAVRKPDTLPDTPGWDIRVVTNKFPALSAAEPHIHKHHGMFERRDGAGAHEVVIETPGHFDYIQGRSDDAVIQLLETYRLRLESLMDDESLTYAQLFKNNGEQSGASLAHPHTQIIATAFIPHMVKQELRGSKWYYETHSHCVFCSMIDSEREEGLRFVYENDLFVSFCPYASRFPYEVWLVPKPHNADYTRIQPAETAALADCLKVTLKKLVAVLGDPQYNYLLHTAPYLKPPGGFFGELRDYYHYHIELYPRLTKIAGFELGTGIHINPTLPEDAAANLRDADIS